jgi:hypothetical protein
MTVTDCRVTVFYSYKGGSGASVTAAGTTELGGNAVPTVIRRRSGWVR